MVIDFEGNVDDDTVFTYDDNTEVYASCAATLQSEFWVVGGRYKERQVIIKGQKTIPVPDGASNAIFILNGVM